MTAQKGQREIPLAYGLKQHIVRRAGRTWCAPTLPRMLAASVYLFPDSVSFDSDDLGRLSQALLSSPFRLPHTAVLFEVVQSTAPGDRVVAYAEEDDGQVDACLFQYLRERGIWTDALAFARFRHGGEDDFFAHPGLASDSEATVYAEVLAGVVGRALALLAMRCAFQPHTVPSLRRRGCSRHVASGWTYRVAEIDPFQIKVAATRLGGSHASPRWHLRRGHWCQLADGRRVFVRECEVGDPSRGGVVKDYHVQLGEAA
jgi:hypothetical protein